MYHDTNENSGNSTFVVGVVTAILGIAVGFLGASVLLKPSETIITEAPMTDTKAANFRVSMNSILRQRTNLLLEVSKNQIDNQESELSASQNQVELNSDSFSDALESIYGEETGNALNSLLDQQVTATINYAKASRDNNAGLMDQENSNLTANIEALATKLSEVNSDLPKDAILQLLTENTTYLRTAVDAYAAGNFAESYTKLAEGLVQSGLVADAIAGATVKHNSEKFE